MKTPLQTAAQAVISKWDKPLAPELLGTVIYMAALRKALEAEQAQAEPTGWHPTDAAITALKRFEETCADNEGYDVPKDTMRNLQVIGLIYRTYGDMYCITDFGQHILASPPAKAEQARAVEPVGWLYDFHADYDEIATDWFSKDYDEAHSLTMGCHNIRPLYTHPAPPPAGERTKVGDSQFESWYAETKIQQMGTKQRYREAYEAGLNKVQQVAVPATDGEIYTAYITATNQILRTRDEKLALAFARAIEAHHGITPQRGKS